MSGFRWYYNISSRFSLARKNPDDSFSRRFSRNGSSGLDFSFLVWPCVLFFSTNYFTTWGNTWLKRSTYLFASCFGYCTFRCLFLVTFFWLQLLLTAVLPEPINHNQYFLLRAREICVLMAEQLFQYFQYSKGSKTAASLSVMSRKMRNGLRCLIAVVCLHFKKLFKVSNWLYFFRCP